MTAMVSERTTGHFSSDLPITRRMIRVDLDGSRRIEPAHVGRLVGRDGSRRIQKDRLDDHRDDQSASDTESDGKGKPSVAVGREEGWRSV
jgi:hypothetical protein